MSFKNSLKLLASNFSVVWKHLVYVLLSVALTVGLIFLFASPIVDCLVESGWTATAAGLIKTVYTDPIAVFDVIKEIALSFFTVMTQNFSELWFSVLGLLVCGYFVPCFVTNIGFYNVSSVMHKQMTSLLAVGYTQNLISTLRSSVKYSFVKMVLKLPFDIVKILLLLSFFRLSTSFFTNLIFLSLLFALIILITSLELTVLSAFAPCMIDRGGNPFRCFSKSVVPVFKKFMKTYSTSLIICLTVIFVNMFLGVFTVFSGLIVTIPASSVFVAIFGNVVYLASNQKRYYLTRSIIVNPVGDDSRLNKDE